MSVLQVDRLGETRKTLWKNISFIEKRWLIPKEDAKNGVAMSPGLKPGSLRGYLLISGLSNWITRYCPSSGRGLCEVGVAYVTY